MRLVLAVWLLAACRAHPPGGGVGDACSTDAQCALGLSCDNGACDVRLDAYADARPKAR